MKLVAFLLVVALNQDEAGPSIREAVQLLRHALSEAKNENMEAAENPEVEQQHQHEFLSKRVIVSGQKYKRVADGTTLVQATHETKPQEQAEKLFFGGSGGMCEYCDPVWCWIDTC